MYDSCFVSAVQSLGPWKEIESDNGYNVLVRFSVHVGTSPSRFFALNYSSFSASLIQNPRQTDRDRDRQIHRAIWVKLQDGEREKIG